MSRFKHSTPIERRPHIAQPRQLGEGHLAGLVGKGGVPIFGDDLHFFAR